MFTIENVHEAIVDFEKEFAENIKGIEEINLIQPFVDKDEVTVRSQIKNVFNNAVIALPEGIDVPKIRQDFVLFSDGDLKDSVQVYIKDLQGKKVSWSVNFSATSSKEAIIDWFTSVFGAVITASCRKANLSRINEVIAVLNKDAGNPFEVVFVDDSNPICSISNDKVELGIAEPAIFGFNDLMLFQEKVIFDPTDIETGVITELEVIQATDFNKRYDETWSQAVAMWGAESVIEFIQKRNDLTKVLTNFKLKKLPSLLRGSISKNPVWLTRTPKDIEVKYDVEDVFAIVGRKNGVLEVVLSPVNVTTGEPVDIDVVQKIEELIK